MSLVRAPRSHQRLAGVVLLALLGGGVTAVLLLSGRTIGPGIRFTVEMKRTGALRPSARIKLAGRDVGEVRGMVLDRADGAAQQTGEPGDHRARHVLLDCFVAKPWDAEVRTNSELFVSTPSILGEAWLEIAPTRNAPPGPPLVEGARLRGAEPPALDELIGRIYRGINEIGALLREHRPALDQLVLAGARLSVTLDEVGLGDVHLRELRDRVRTSLDDARAISDAVRNSGVTSRMSRTEQAWIALADEAGPKLRALGSDAERVAQSLDALSDFIPPEKRAEVTRAITQLRAAAKAGESVAAIADELQAIVDRGDGTVGGLLADKELFDDLHETHRILKNQGWKLIAKPAAGGKTPTR